MPGRNTLIVFLALLCLAPSARAADSAVTVDLILPPALADKGAPLYRGAKVKIGDQLLPVREGALPIGQLAAFVPDQHSLIISNNPDASEEAKNKALFDVLDALQAGAVAPAAGE